MPPPDPPVAPPFPARSRRQPRPIVIYLLALALVALIPAFTFSAVLLQRNNESRERVVETLISGTSRSIVQAIERELTANITTLRVLATTPFLLSGDYRAFYDQVRAALGGTDTSLSVLDDKLSTILNTRTEFGAPPAFARDPVAVRSALDGGHIAVSDLALGSASERWVFNVFLPIVRPGKPPMVLDLSRRAEGLSTALLSNKLPEGWNVALVDSAGQIIAASPGAGITGDYFTLADPASLARGPGFGRLTAGGVTYSTVVGTSFLTGWKLISWAPQSVTAKPLVEAVWSLVVGGVVLAAVVILIIYWVTRQIARSVRGLATDAKLLGGGLPVPARDYPITEIATISTAIEDASRRRLAAEAEVRFLMRELAHRSKNQMTIIAAMAKQTARGADSVAEFVQNFEKRIFGLARSTDLLLANGVAGVDLADLLSGQITPFCPEDGSRVALNGPAIRLNSQSASILGMAAHELATNAVKHGAFATEGGALAVFWARTPEHLTLIWRETLYASGVLPKGDMRRGFGTTVLENMVGRALNAEIVRTLHEDGIEWSFKIPLAGLDPAAALGDETPEAAPKS